MDVQVLWRRGNHSLPSKSAQLDPKTHEAKIDDQFRMKTNLDYDAQDKKYLPKNSVLDLIFAKTQQVIGFVELDIG